MNNEKLIEENNIDNYICQGKGCHVRKNDNLNSVFGDFYKCEICNKKFCVNCIYLYCSTCNNFVTCFWCGTNYKHKNNISYLEKVNIKCAKCSK